MAELECVPPTWKGRDCIVAAPGPSLTGDVVRRVRLARMAYSWKVLAVQDAYKVLPHADVMYGCCPTWWRVHKTCPGFEGEKWSTHDKEVTNNKINTDKALGHPIADFGMRLVAGEHGDEFSTDPGLIRYGSNSGFQAINLAILFGARKIVLVGYDMRCVSGKSHFFGDHPKGLHQNKDEDYRRFVGRFDKASKALPEGVHIINATPDSALKCFPIMTLSDALSFVGSPQ